MDTLLEEKMLSKEVDIGRRKRDRKALAPPRRARLVPEGGARPGSREGVSPRGERA